MTEDRPPETLDELGARLKEVRARSEAGLSGRGAPKSGQGPGGEGSLLGLAFRFGVELVSALAVGLGIGYVLDRWLGTTPWFMVVFFFLGAAAGMLNVYRATLSLGMGETGTNEGKGQQSGIPGAGNTKRPERDG